MPTAIPSGEKTAAINKIKAYGCDRVASISSAMNNYEDLVPLFFAYQTFFEYDPVFLASLASVFTQGSLNTVGIYYNITGTNVDNPQIIINSTYSSVSYDGTPLGGIVAVIGNSQIDTFTTSVNIGVISISSGASVKALITSGSACITRLRVVGQGNYIGSLELATSGSCINVVETVGTGIYGGANDRDYTTPCTTPVSLLNATMVTKDEATITWTNPSGSINTIIQYRLKGSDTWLNPGQEEGIQGNMQISLAAYSIRGLKADTYYEIQAISICASGMQSPVVTTSFLTSECCEPVIVGSNSTSHTYEIVSSPDPAAGDGTPQNPFQLGPGNTITISELVGKTILWPVILNDGAQQNFSYDGTTGTFDNTANGGFVVGDLFTVNFNG